MIDDDAARANWWALFEQHVTVVARQSGVSMPHGWAFKLPDTPVTRAVVQAYHEGAEGFRAKRAS